MYTAFYGLREKPFALSPDPRFLYLAASHREALAHLLYGIDEGEGFIAVTGEVGTGKTTLCRSLLDRLGSETEVAFLFNPSQTAGELLHAIAGEFGFDDRNATRHELGDRLNRFLLDRKRDGRRVLLIVDEAQNLSNGTLEQIRLLSNLETSSEKLIQILLLGQPELDEKLDSPALRQLRQRIGVRWCLGPLDSQETREYVRHRLRIAAGEERDIVDEAALAEVHRRTRGVPRLINVLCDRALLAGYAAKQRRIGVDLIRRVAEEIPDTRARTLRRSRAATGGRHPWRIAVRVAAALSLVAGATAAGFYFDQLRDEGRRAIDRLSGAFAPAPPAVASAPPTAPVAREVSATASAPVEAAPPAPATTADLSDPRTARGRALNTLLASFGIEAVPGAPADDDDLLQMLADNGLAVLEMGDAKLDEIRSLDHPALLSLRSDDGGDRLAALLSLGDDSGTFYGLTERGSVELPTAEIESRWDGRAFVVWRDFESVPNVIGRGSEVDAVRWVQTSLARLGLYAGEPSGRFDRRTEQGVKALQLTRQLEPDGAVGPRTRMVIYDLLDQYAVPRLAGHGSSG